MQSRTARDFSHGYWKSRPCQGSLDLDAGDFEVELTGRNRRHAVVGGGAFVGAIGSLLRRRCHWAESACKAVWR